jgi:hypothetical protein
MDESSKVLYVGLDVHKDSTASPTLRCDSRVQPPRLLR